MTIRPRRSVLYMPASNERALKKARTLPADVIVVDLEDSVAAEKKALARQQCIAAIQQGGYGNRERVIRINSQDSQWWEQDVAAVATSGVDAICLPKVESVSQVNYVVTKLQQAGAPDSLGIWVMTETPMGVLNLLQVAAHPRVNVAVMGTTDLAKALRVPHMPDRSGLLHSLGHCILVARTCGVDILDGIHLDLEDDDGFGSVCKQGRELGFDGKTLIHPKQISAANQYFGPSKQDLLRAEKIIVAWQQVEAEGKGVAVVDGKLVESMHVDEAKRHLAMAELIGHIPNV